MTEDIDLPDLETLDHVIANVKSAFAWLDRVPAERIELKITGPAQIFAVDG